jgi:hypothetical protein
MENILPGFKERLREGVEKAFELMLESAGGGSSWDSDLDKATDALLDVFTRELVGLTTIFAAKLHDELAGFENTILKELEQDNDKKAFVTEVKRRALERLLKLPLKVQDMAITSSAFGDNQGKPLIAPYVIDLPLKDKNPIPQPGWEGAEVGKCPRCQKEVWMHDKIKLALHQTNVTVMCSDCATTERIKQSKG